MLPKIFLPFSKRLAKLSKFRRLLLLLAGFFLIFSLVLWYFFVRPAYQSARALSDLEASFAASLPCHENCLANRLNQRSILIKALQDGQPGLEEEIAKIISDSQTAENFRRELKRLLAASQES